jgi:hypothetical protein
MALAAAAFLAVAGCASYYEVKDPQTGKGYYTTGLDQSGNGAVTFTDARTGDKVTLQNSQVEEITQQQFENGKNGASTQP